MGTQSRANNRRDAGPVSRRVRQQYNIPSNSHLDLRLNHPSQASNEDDDLVFAASVEPSPAISSRKLTQDAGLKVEGYLIDLGPHLGITFECSTDIPEGMRHSINASGGNIKLQSSSIGTLSLLLLNFDQY